MNSIRVVRALTVGASLWILTATANPLTQPATVTVNEPGEWHVLTTHALVASADTTTGPSTYWRQLPEFLLKPTLEFYFLTADPAKKSAERYGRLDFTAAKDGIVWMMTTVRFTDSGNASGDWIPEVSTEDELKAKGWRVISRDIESESGYSAAGQNTAFVGWILFERNCKAGETFSIRAEKYQSPVLLRALVPRLSTHKLPASTVALDGIVDFGVYTIQSSGDLVTWRDELTMHLGPGFRMSFGSALGDRRFFRVMRVSQ